MHKKIEMLSILFWILGLGISIGHTDAASSASDSKPSAPQYIHAYRHSETSLKITWKRVKSADGYAVLRYDSKAKKYTKINTIEGNTKHQIFDNKLKTNKVYRYQVKAYVKKNRKKKYGDASYYAEAKTYRRKDKVVNAGKISSDKKVTLGITMSKKMDTYVMPSKYGKNKKKRALTQKVRWKSSNEEIATVTAKGKIVAGIKEGTCTVYAIAHNGNRRKIKVTVINYAYPTSFDGYSGVEPVVTHLLNNYRNEICNIASYFTIHRPAEDLTLQLDSDGNVTCNTSGVDLTAIQSDLERLLRKFPYNIKVETDNLCVYFYMEKLKEDGDVAYWCYVEYYFDDSYKQFDRIIAEHWRYFRFVPVG